MSNLKIIPFTEMMERAMKFAREDSINVEDKYKGLINDVYTKKVPRMFDWNPLKRTSYIQCTAYYNTGTVSISAAGTSLVGVGTVWTSGMTVANGWKIKFSGNPNIYTFEYVSGTTGTISPGLSGANAIAAGSYELFRDTYSLASDFDRFLINGGIEYTRGGQPDIITVTPDDAWKCDFQSSPQDNPCRMRIIGAEDDDGYDQLQINPPPRTALMLPYDYIKEVAGLTEYTTGTIYTLANGSTAVTGVGTAFSSYIQTGYTYYFRLDRDGTGDASVWYKVSSATNATALVLDSAYAGTAVVAGTLAYTISMVPELPYTFHDILLYLTTMMAIADQKDEMYSFYANLAQQGMDEIELIYKTRTYSKFPRVVIDRR